jgi:hypothetical protein
MAPGFGWILRCSQREFRVGSIDCPRRQAPKIALDRINAPGASGRLNGRPPSPQIYSSIPPAVYEFDGDLEPRYLTEPSGAAPHAVQPEILNRRIVNPEPSHCQGLSRT